MLHGCGKHPPAPIVLVETQQHAEPQHIAPSKDTSSPAPGIAGSREQGAGSKTQDSPLSFPALLPAPSSSPPACHIAVLGAEWCGPCKRLEREVLPDLADLNLKIVDIDKEADLAAKLFSPKTHAVPQFVLLDGSDSEKPSNWLVGYQSAERVRKFLQQPASAPEPSQRTKTGSPLPAANAANGPRETRACLRRIFSRCP